MSGLEQMVADYLRVRRSLGFKLDDAEYILTRFVNHVQAAEGSQTVTVAHALAFATAPVGASRRWQALRLSAIRCFARWAQTVDPTIEVPPPRLLPARPTRTAPYIYTNAEIGALLDAAGAAAPGDAGSDLSHADRADGGHRNPHRGSGRTRHCRPGPAGENLDRDRKIRQDTQAPAPPTAAAALAQYLDLRNEVLPAAACPALLISTRGNRLCPSVVQQTFRQLGVETGLRTRSGACRPRLHDLRHTFAVSTMLDAYTRGADPAAVLPLLSTWLGHCEPSDTYW